MGSVRTGTPARLAPAILASWRLPLNVARWALLHLSACSPPFSGTLGHPVCLGTPVQL